MRSFVQVLTTPTADTPGTTLILHFDKKRYLIGSLGEGTQRACVQMGARLLKVSECFVTGRTEWSNVGGLLGMVLTLADSAASSQASALEEALFKAKAKAKREGWSEDYEKMRKMEDEIRNEVKANSVLNIFGPQNMNHMLATARRFIFRKGMPLNVHEVRGETHSKDTEEPWAPYWADDNIKVWAMSISPDSSTKSPSSSEGSSASPRKRSIEQVYEGEAVPDGTVANDLSPKERDMLTVKAVVSEMFDSTWRLDTLHETPLSSVRLPATIFVRNSDTNKVERYQGPLPGGPQPLPDPNRTVLVRRPWPGALIESLPYTEPAKQAISYIIRNHLQRGKFNKQRAVELKVEEGPKFRELSNGNSVLNKDGETITSDMVLGETRDGGGFAVVDLPDPSYIDNLINRPEWREAKVMAGVGAIIWICGQDVAQDLRVTQFMKEFVNLQHIVSSAEHCPNQISMDSSAASTVRLRKIDPVRFRTPVHDDAIPKVLSGTNVTMAARGQVVQLEPSFELQDKQIVPPLSIAEVEKEMSSDILGEAAKAHQAIEADQDQESLWAANIPDKEAEIITLGTGSALPSKYRNVSATLLRVPGWGSMLFDCGENTLGQLKRVFTPTELQQVLRELRLIFISHMHADHHLGTVGVIKAWYAEVHNSQPASTDSLLQSQLNDQRRLAVVSEPAMLQWLMEYAAVEDYGYSRLASLHISPHERNKRRPSKLGWFVPPTEFTGLTPQERMEKHARNSIPASHPILRLTDIQAVSVTHCHGARAVSISFPSGLKVSYSGDCRPSTAFAHIGRGSHVCIHEATFDDELLSDAKAKNHSTTSEALGVAQAMGAKACVLTHFSQRYQKLPVLEYRETEEEKAEEESLLAPAPTAGSATTAPPEAVRLKVSADMRVAVAFDYMRIKVGEIGQMEKFTPALLKLFAEEDKSEKTGNGVVGVEEGEKGSGKKKGKGKRGGGA
ncbi:hypothetical protein BDY17DRAFT_270459 [Neohortaea acidophila]|uniref:ribonuclease Z n=1 Tax=Neohortaea acidophila TaxID=245834 RepID=A0A6A6PLC1_9PEZI|nr:uncharacterized protein BDY17DRAFT_270459 [Neohortaea acidophila]KAF2480878.1 hypothetical protein BDY17DRAFT_270459 [Neohortaea acidophila]